MALARTEGGVLVLKRSLRPGFAGEDDDSFYNQHTMMIFGDARSTLMTLNQLIKRANGTPAVPAAASHA